MKANTLQREFILPAFPRINTQAVWIAGFILTAALLVFYIFQVNKIAKDSFLIQSYEQKIVGLNQENNSSEIYFSQLNSPENIEILARKLNYEKVGKIQYIRLIDGTVAKR